MKTSDSYNFSKFTKLQVGQQKAVGLPVSHGRVMQSDDSTATAVSSLNEHVDRLLAEYVALSKGNAERSSRLPLQGLPTAYVEAMSDQDYSRAIVRQADALLATIRSKIEHEIPTSESLERMAPVASGVDRLDEVAQGLAALNTSLHSSVDVYNSLADSLNDTGDIAFLRRLVGEENADAAVSERNAHLTAMLSSVDEQIRCLVKGVNDTFSSSGLLASFKEGKWYVNSAEVSVPVGAKSVTMTFGSPKEAS